MTGNNVQCEVELEQIRDRRQVEGYDNDLVEKQNTVPERCDDGAKAKQEVRHCRRTIERRKKGRNRDKIWYRISKLK